MAGLQNPQVPGLQKSLSEKIRFFRYNVGSFSTQFSVSTIEILRTPTSELIFPQLSPRGHRSLLSLTGREILLFFDKSDFRFEKFLCLAKNCLMGFKFFDARASKFLDAWASKFLDAWASNVLDWFKMQKHKKLAENKIGFRENGKRKITFVTTS